MPTKKLVTSYVQDLKLFPDRWHTVGLVTVVAILLLIPFVASDRWITIANLASTSVVGAVGLMVLTGFAGQVSLGHAAFLAIGAYTVAVLGNEFHLPFWIGIPLGGLAAALAGLMIGPFALRLRGLYLAIVTLGMLLLVAHVLHAFPELTGGVSGIAVPMHTWFEGSTTFDAIWHVGGYEIGFEKKLYVLYVILAAATAMASKNIQRSDLGRAMIAVRDHDIAAAVLGIDPARTKIIAFAISSFFAGVAGAMFAYQQQYITIEPPFDLNMSIQYIAMLVLGGIGTTFGAVAGAIAFTVLSPLAESAGRQVPFLADNLSSAQLSTVLFAMVVCLLLMFEPLGLLGFWLRIKRYFAAWPFRY